VNSVTEARRLWNRNFSLLWQGQFVSQLGNRAYYIAMIFWLKHTVDSASTIGLIVMLSMLPSVILGPFGGTFADNYSRKKIIILSDLLCGLVVTVLALLVFFAPHATSLIIIWLTVTSFTLGTVSAVFSPAISASIPDMVPENKVAAANSFNQSSIQVSSLLGQGTGGVLFRILGAPVLFLADGLSFLVAATCSLFIKIPQVIPEKKKCLTETLKKFGRDTAEGFRYVWYNKGLRDLIITAAIINFLLSPLSIMLPFYFEDILHATPDWFGYFLASQGGGTIIGFAIAGAIKISGRRRSTFMVATIVLACLALGSLGTIEGRVAPLVVALIVGILLGIFNISFFTVLQVTTPSEMRGRVIGLVYAVTGGLAPLGTAFGGVLIDLLGKQNIPLIFIVGGILTTTCILLASSNRDFRAFLAFNLPEKSG